tara:strand:- start:6443 stop:6778 length:336 start_codon:yes stop_codon:yes gene_type:complete
MATTFTWSYDSLERDVTKDGLDDVIVTSYWRITGVDGDHSATTYGAASIAAPDPDDFTAFADVTQAQVKAWTLSSLADQDITEATLEAGLQAQIDTLKNPTQKSGVPADWS